jgi:hypothetical protein
MKREELKRIVETQIKKLYAEVLLREDIEKRNKMYNLMRTALDPDLKWTKARQDASAPQRGRMMGRLLKKIFAKLVDRSFVDSLVTIHWASYGGIERAMGKHVSSKDELSCNAYLPQKVKQGGMGTVGLLVKGHITLLANDMDHLWTGSGEAAAADFPLMKKTSGANKGVHRSFRTKEFFNQAVLVFDKKDWKPATNRVGGYRNEALVDNWKALAVVFETVDELEKAENQELIEMVNQRGLEVLTIGDLNDAEYDFVKKEWYPEEEDEAEEEEKPDEP